MLYVIMCIIGIVITVLLILALMSSLVALGLATLYPKQKASLTDEWVDTLYLSVICIAWWSVFGVIF